MYIFSKSLKITLQHLPFLDNGLFFLDKGNHQKAETRMATQSTFIKKVPGTQQILDTPLLKQKMKVMINFRCQRSDEEKVWIFGVFEITCTQGSCALKPFTITAPRPKPNPSKKAKFHF